MKARQPLSISFEFFPPKTPEGINTLKETAYLLAQYQPHFFSVTFGAGGSTREGTLAAVKLLQQSAPVLVAPHVSCMGSERSDIVNVLHSYQALGIKRIVALRGDLGTANKKQGQFRFASELVSVVRDITGDCFHIEVAAYPEIHPEAASVKDDILNLKRKYEAGANSAITQYFFNADAYFYYRDECLKQGIPLPIVPGIMPILQFDKLVSFSNVCGAEIPLWMHKRFASYAGDAPSIKAFGLEVVGRLCEQLIAGGVPGLHFYTLNRAELSLSLIENVIGLRAFSPAKKETHHAV